MVCVLWKLVPTITISPAKDAHGEFWHVDIKCQYPSNLDKKEKLRLMQEARREGCRRHCQYDIDRHGLNRLLYTFLSDEVKKYITIKGEEET